MEQDDLNMFDSIFTAATQQRKEKEAQEAAERQKEERRLIAAAKEKARIEQLEAEKRTQQQSVRIKF